MSSITYMSRKIFVNGLMDKDFFLCFMALFMGFVHHLKPLDTVRWQELLHGDLPGAIS